MCPSMALLMELILSLHIVLNWREMLLRVVAAEKLSVLLKTFRMISEGRSEKEGEYFVLAG